jgi:hypothetical protein
MLSYRSLAAGHPSVRELARSVGVGAPVSLRDALQRQLQVVLRSRIHEDYLRTGGHTGPLGFPTSSVQFAGTTAIRNYRGGEVHATANQDGPLGVVTQALKRRHTSIRFLGFRCLALSNELSANDEPYFVIAVDNGNGVPLTKKFGPFENVDQGTEIGVGELLVSDVSPDPLAIRVMAYENDEGDPDETAREIQEKMVEIAQATQAALGATDAASAADGPGLGPSAAAGAVGIVAGPLGSLLAVGIVAAFGLGDDFIGQGVSLAFIRPENVGTPPEIGKFQGNSFNAQVDVAGDGEGHHQLFFDIHVFETDPHTV